MIVEVGTIDWYEYLTKFGVLEKNSKNVRRKDSKYRILNVYSAFDIETSIIWLDEDRTKYDCHSFMYVWQMQVEEYTVKGRTWEEFFDWLKVLQSAIERIKDDNHLEYNPRLLIWVMNLAYEWQWLSGLYPFTNDDCFFRDERKPIYCRMYDIFEFRCAYIQTNMSLSALCKQTGVKQKLSGQKYDYEKVRYPWTPLTEYEQEYTTVDVESLVQAMKYRISRGGDTLQTVPLTSTGYVRRDCKEALKDKYLFMRDLKPSERAYRLLRAAFRGGNTHANREKVNKILSDVYSYDISSSYPTQQLTKLFPMKPFRFLDLPTGKTKKDALKRLERAFMFIGLGYAVVGTYQFKELRLKDTREPIPYISLSKCKAMGTDETEMIIDNGRIMQCGYCEISMTEIDLRIVLDTYDYDSMDIMECMVAQKDYLPYEYRQVIQDYYNKKTALKGDDTEDGKYTYTKSKNMLNAVYGMSATDPIHQEIIYKGGDYEHTSYETMTKEQIEQKLKNASFPYQWGVY